jgi:hypothetical protein
VAVTIYLLILVAALIGIVIFVFGPQAESALCNIVAQDRPKTRVFKGCSI